jgi:hypothetical protein
MKSDALNCQLFENHYWSVGTPSMSTIPLRRLLEVGDRDRKVLANRRTVRVTF